MKKILVMLLCLATFIMAGCGDKYAKEKEAITKAEKAAMAIELPVVETTQGFEKFRSDLDKLIKVEEQILVEMRKSDAKIAELEVKSESNSDKKKLQEFKDNLRKERVAYVKKISKGRLRGDTFIVGVGSTWQEVEMAYGKPSNLQVENKGYKVYKYGGIVFGDHIGGGVPSKAMIMKWKSRSVSTVNATGHNIVSDVGVKIGMSREDVVKALKSKFVKKENNQKNEMYIMDGFNPVTKSYYNIILSYSTQETMPSNIYLEFKDDKLTKFECGFVA